MPRLPRVNIEGALCYVTCRGLQNQAIFKDERDYEMYFGLLKRYKDQHSAKIYAYSLMSNHLHLLLEMDKNAILSDFMHDLTSAYTKYFNGRYNRKGHLFRERYKAAVVENEPKVLANLSVYIHLNPKKLGLVINAETYPYSSYGLYLNYDQASDHGLALKQEIEKILSALLGKDYKKFVEDLEKSEKLRKLHKHLQRRGVWGSEEFTAKVREEILQKQKIQETADTEGAPEQEKKSESKMLKNTGSAILIVTLTAAGIYLYFNYAKEKNLLDKKVEPKVETTARQPEVKTALDELDMTYWQIELFLSDGQVAEQDVISFNQGKFSSVHLARLDYQNTNYTRVLEDDKIIWETMQASPKGTASWRGEIKDGKMRGILSLRPKEVPSGAEGRQDGEAPQDFSFKSVSYRRK